MREDATGGGCFHFSPPVVGGLFYPESVVTLSRLCRSVLVVVDVNGAPRASGPGRLLFVYPRRVTT